MTLVPFTECCAMLGIDAKTLRHWLRQANVEWTAHPTDARLKCLTKEQVEGVATLHARPLPSPVSASPALPEAAPARPESEVQLLEASILLPTSVLPEADLRKQLACLEAKLSTMQAHLAQLALEVLHEHAQRYERRLSALEALLPHPGDRSADPPVSHASVGAAQPQALSLLELPLHPAEQRARSRVIPLIEFGARGQYVIVESPSLFPPAPLQTHVRSHRPSDDPPFRAGGGETSGGHGRALIC
jgi:hypothetical protein